MEIVRAIESRHSVAGIHNVEGFIRQVLGWREFTRVLYRAEYRAMKTKNVFQFSRVLTPAWYEGTTGLKPVDDVIRQAIDWGYLHHIQRLMVMGNILSLVHISPDEAYRWFMEFAIDSYDWVMISNVYGMASHSDEGITTTKPYVSSSNYILGMSDWKADGRWDVDWRTLYYNFIGTLRLPNGDYYFAKNRRTAIAWRNWERLGVEEQRAIMARGKEIIGRLTGD
jgi:deoxyribodipyrimidine photolyase-related protein